MATLAPSLRQGLIAGAIALALTGGGAAAVWAGTQPSPSPSGSTTLPSAAPSTSAKANPAEGRVQSIHGEHVVKQADGSFQTILTQAGTIESVNATDLTVKSADGFTQRYVINGDTRILKLPADAFGQRQGKGKPTLPSATVADLKAGDTVRVGGVKNGDTVTATKVAAGELPGGLLGHGHRRGHGPH